MRPIAEQCLEPTGFHGAERRTERRRRVLKGATLSFNSGFSAFECVLRDISHGGARLSLAETFGLPTSFWLAIAGEETVRMAHVVWSRTDAIGVSFGAA